MTTRKQFYILYKTTNTVNGKFYIGMHTTYTLDDGYMGSGLRIKRSIQKHGIEQHKREILYLCDSRQELINLERTTVNEQLLADQMCMNIRIGGEGGGKFSVEQQRENNRRSQIAQRKLRKDDHEWVERFSRKKSDILKKAYAEGSRVSITKPHIKGEFKHSDESKRKIGEKNSITQQGNKNSQFGTCWITKDKENKKIKKDKLKSYMEKGWCKGRFIHQPTHNEE